MKAKVNKTKKEKLSKISNIKKHRQEEGKNGFPDPIPAQCFKCPRNRKI